MTTTSYKVPINHEVLRWARESIRVDIERAAKAASVNANIYKKWEYGQDFPTLSKLRLLSNLFKRPLPVFFMSKIPKEPPIPKDFRKPILSREHPLTKESLFAIRKARWYQSTAGDLMHELGKPIKPIEKYALKNKPIEQCIKDIRTVNINTQLAWESNWEGLKYWREHLENLGIFVFQMCMPLNETRGFSLVRENYPPAIVINSKDSPNGRIFTLFHEFCHILLDEPGVCVPEDSEFKHEKYHETEELCDEFAGNFLVPTEYLEKFIEMSKYTDIGDLINDLSRKFSVSNFVILRRMYSLKRIDYRSYRRLFAEFQKKIKNIESTGGDFYKNKFAEKGNKFISLVVEAESGNTITTSKALEYLEIKLKHYPRIVDMLFQ
jgi:Zn-dependent peptidase ImmA (M78 family)